jgi:hypothetical protein
MTLCFNIAEAFFNIAEAVRSTTNKNNKNIATACTPRTALARSYYFSSTN